MDTIILITVGRIVSGMKGDEGGQQQGGSMLMMMMVLFLVIFILLNPVLLGAIGSGIGLVLYPAIGFGGTLPLITIFSASIVMALISTAVRHYFIDWVDVAKNQKVMSAFNKVRREALMDRNMARLEKLNEQQTELMKRTMKSTTCQLKPMVVTMIIIIMFFAWLNTFISLDVANINFSVPWAADVTLKGSYIFPHWIFIYMLCSIPMGMIFQRVLKYYSFTAKLRRMADEGLLMKKEMETEEEEEEETPEERGLEKAPAEFICTICSKRLKKGEWAVKCKCGKYYHEECSMEKGRCPTCARKLGGNGR